MWCFTLGAEDQRWRWHHCGCCHLLPPQPHLPAPGHVRPLLGGSVGSGDTPLLWRGTLRCEPPAGVGFPVDGDATGGGVGATGDLGCQRGDGWPKPARAAVAAQLPWVQVLPPSPPSPAPCQEFVPSCPGADITSPPLYCSLLQTSAASGRCWPPGALPWPTRAFAGFFLLPHAGTPFPSPFWGPPSPPLAPSLLHPALGATVPRSPSSTGRSQD